MSEASKILALSRFRNGTDTREDRDILRAYRIDRITMPGGKWRIVPTADQEDVDIRASVIHRAIRARKSERRRFG